MGKIWASGDGVDIANLNSTFAFEARVDGSIAATSGTTFKTIQAALDSGARSIFVVPAIYPEDITIANNNVLLVGGRPQGEDSGFPGVRIGSSGGTTGGKILVTGNNVHLVSLTSLKSTATGFVVAAATSGHRLINCSAYQSAQQGFVLNYSAGAGAGYAYNNEMRGCVAGDCGGTLYSGFYFQDTAGDAATEIEWLLDHCTAFSSGMHGFEIFNGSSGSAAIERQVHLNACIGWMNGTTPGVGGSGVYVGTRAGVTINGGSYRSNKETGIYLSSPASAAARSQITGARCRFNTVYGIACQSTTGAEKHVIIGNSCKYNGGGGAGAQLASCSTAIGYAQNYQDLTAGA